MKPRAVLILTLTLSLLAAPLAAQAQPVDKVARIGIMTSGINPRSASFFEAFEQRLRDHGWVEGKNIVLNFRAPNHPGAFAAVAADFARRRST